MTREVEILQAWALAFLAIAAVCSTLFPLVWSFSRWWDRLLGRLLMLQAVSLAVALDLTLLFSLWDPGPEHFDELLWLNIIVFGLLALSTLLLTATVIRMNYFRHRKKKETIHE